MRSSFLSASDFHNPSNTISQLLMDVILFLDEAETNPFESEQDAEGEQKGQTYRHAFKWRTYSPPAGKFTWILNYLLDSYFLASQEERKITIVSAFLDVDNILIFMFCTILQSILLFILCPFCTMSSFLFPFLLLYGHRI